MVTVATVVKHFKENGFTCRKEKRGKNVYKCVDGDATAIISDSNIEVKVYTEYRDEYSNYVPDDYSFEEDFIRDLEEATGASRITTDIIGETYYNFIYELDDYQKALELAKKIRDNGIWFAITNISAELRPHKMNKQTEEYEPINAKELIELIRI